jgi:hypothetical protein
VIENLAHSLLRLSGAGLPIILSGRTLKDHLGPALERALGRRVLVELPRLDEWSPCAGCDQQCEARPIRELNGRLVAMCPYDSTSDEILSDDDLRQFQLDPEELCLAIREDSGLSGDGPTEIADRIWLIGQTRQDETPSRCLFLAFDTSFSPSTAMVATIQRTAGRRVIALLLIGDPDLAVRLALEDARILAVPALELLADDAITPFRLDFGRLSSGPLRPRLVLRCSDRSVMFGDKSVRLPPQLFKLLLFLVTEAQAGRPLVENQLIERKLWGTAIHSRQPADAIRRLRDELAPVLDGREQVRRLVQNKPGSYLIDLDFAAIEIL